jgi:hypothetical protein
MADQYDRMNTAQLEEQATERGFDLAEFQSLRNNDERKQRLRDHDAARDADAEVAARNAEQARQAQEQQGDQASGSDSVQVQRDSQNTTNGGQQTADNSEKLRPAGEGDTPAYEQTGRQVEGDPGPYDVAPYPNEESRQAAQDAAAGNLSTRQGIDPDKAPPVGGQGGETPAEQDHTS